MNRPALRTAPGEEAPLELQSPPPPSKPRRLRAWIIAVVGILGVVAMLVGIKASQIKAMINAGKSFSLPPESVTSATVLKAQWQSSRTAVGTLVAVHSVTISSEAPGSVRFIGFDSGAFVRRGQVLVKLDTSTELAQLAAAKADTSLAKSNLRRARVLREQNSNAPAELDAAESRSEQTQATESVLQATIAKKTIYAPFDGRLGIRQVELGQVLAPGTPIASLQSISPIHAEFWLPQQALADLQLGLQARLLTDVYPKDHWDGQVTTINPEVDTSTRNVRVRATFPNLDGRLRPGMFANVELLSSGERPVLIIPATSVIYAPYGDSVFALEQKEKALVARQKFVRLGERRGDLVAVVSGLNAGETIVASGAFKLRNGSTVVVHNEQAAPAEVAPKPTDDK